MVVFLILDENGTGWPAAQPAGGTTTLTPSKAVYTFSPPMRSVTVPPRTGDQDFVGFVGMDRVHLPLVLRQ